MFIRVCRRFRGSAERARFDYLGAEPYMRKPESATDKEAVAEQFAYLVGVSVCSNVEILRPAAQHQIAHAPSHKVCCEPMVFEPVENFQSVRINVPP